MNTTIVVIPTLNEYENVKTLLNKFIDVDVDVVFIDDNSIDLTDQIIENDINFEKILPYKKEFETRLCISMYCWY